MNISENLKSDLILKFKSEKRLKKAIEKKQYYLFEELNSSQLFKLFNIENSKIYSESNAKKHLNKVYDLIKSQFINKKTNSYLNIILNPTNEKKEYENRKKSFEKINELEFNEDENNKIKEIFKNIESLNLKVHFKNRIMSFDRKIVDEIYNKYKIFIELINEKELEEISQNEDLSNAIIITEDSLHIEIPTYSQKDFKKIILGNLIKTNSSQIIEFLELLEITKNQKKHILNSYQINLLNEIKIEFDEKKLKEILIKNNENKINDITNKTLRLEEEVANINKELKEVISKKQLSLDGEELLQILNSGGVESLQEKFQKDIEDIVLEKEKDLILFYKENNIKINCFFSKISYPLKLDLDVNDEILKQIDTKSNELEIDIFEELGKFNFREIENLWSYAFYFDFLYGLNKFSNKFNLKYPQITNLDKDEFLVIGGKNIYIEKANKINYGIGTNNLDLKSEKVAILTGANSGGKTTLLEMYLQIQILTSIGLGIPADEKSKIPLSQKVIYLKKFTGTQGSGAFEQTIRNLIEIISTNEKKLLLIDEFEAITEPGAAAKILINFLEAITKQRTLCIGVSHLGAEIIKFINEKKITQIRLDGISATGLDGNGNLITNHQPTFYKLGKSTPELILKRILQDKKFWDNKSKENFELLEKILN